MREEDEEETARTNPELLPVVVESYLTAFLVAQHPMNHTQTLSVYKLDQFKNKFSRAVDALASYPGSLRGEEECLVHTVRACA